MPDYKCTWFFESLQQQNATTASSYVGWTETWYGTFGNIEAALIAMRSQQPNSYLGRRLAFMPNQYRVSWMRASEVLNPNRAKLAGPPLLTRGFVNRLEINVGEGNPAQINCCVYVDFYVPPVGLTERAHHRRFMIRGLPLGLINGNILNEASQFMTDLLSFCNYLGEGRAPMQVNDNPPAPASPWRIQVQNPANPFLPISSLIVDPDNSYAVAAVAATLAATEGQKFRIKGVRFPAFVNRVWTARATVGAGGSIVMRPGRKQLAGAWDHTGQIQPVVSVLRAATQYVVIGLRNKKIGSPSKPTRGRRQAR